MESNQTSFFSPVFIGIAMLLSIRISTSRYKNLVMYCGLIGWYVWYDRGVELEASFVYFAVAAATA